MRRRTGTTIAHGDHFDVRITLNDGTRSKRACLPAGLTEAQAKAEAARLSALAAATGAVRSPSAKPSEVKGESLDTYADRWMRARSDSATVRPHLRHVLDVLDGQRALAALDAGDVARLRDALDAKIAADAMAPKTAQNVWGTFTKMMGDAYGVARVRRRRGVARLPEGFAICAGTPPTANVEGPQLGHEKSSAWLFPVEVVALLSCAEVPLVWRQLYAVALYTGCRRGELDALRVADVVVSASYVHVARSVERYTGNVKTTKSGKARKVPIEPALMPLLEVLCEGRVPSAPLVSRTAHASRDLRAHLLAAGIVRAELHERDDAARPLSFHDLRHTYATWLALRGGSPFVIKSRLGHGSLSMVERYVEAAEVVGEGVGTPFPELPSALFAKSLESSSVAQHAGTTVEAPGIETVAPAAFPLPSVRVASLSPLSPPDTYATSTPDERERAPLDAREPALDALELRRLGHRVEALH